ncbi:MAG: hypothetical protein ACKO7V_03180, partial [Bacteroidota bacterium]
LQPGQGYWIELKSPIGTTVYGARLDLENPTMALPHNFGSGLYTVFLRDDMGSLMATESLILIH